jgi:7,8-dihydropterin-6-yl-methyl-4-(beta-D-ribofuranosyl)aminobenzene 5'-phosphate synthase
MVVAGSRSDEAVVNKATSVLDENGISYQVEYASAHREPDKVKDIADNSDASVFIAIAGLSAALPGVIASHTKKPVIGVPVAGKLGGLDSILELNPDLHLLVRAGTSPRMIDTLRTLCREVTPVGEEPSEFAPALASTGTLPGETPEQALVISAEEGAVAITGCAHPGIVTIADAARRLTGKNLALLAGGFHLFQTSEEMVSETAEKLAATGVRHILPTHCTGESATKFLREQFKQQFLKGGLGQAVRFDTEGKPVVS